MAKQGRPKKTDGEAPAARAIENFSEEDLQKLFFQGKKDYEKNLAAKKKTDADFKNCCKRIKAELGKRGVAEIKLAIMLADETGEEEAKADIESTIRVMRWMGVPIGTQADLFPDIDPASAADRAFAEGKRQGLSGEPQNNPHHHTTQAHGAHNDGWVHGQHMLASEGFKAPAENTEGSDAVDSLTN